MNSSKTNQILKSISTELETQSTDLTSILTNVGAINLQTGVNGVALSNIETDVNTLANKKIIFNGKLSDVASNLYLARNDYTSSPIIFSWTNPESVPVYIYKYSFSYTEGSEPTSSQLYHGTTYTTKIGLVNTAGTDFEAPYMSYSNNRDHYKSGNSNESKRQWTSDQGWSFEYDFSEAPIEIGVSGKFGHYIAGDFSTSSYDSDPVGNIEGYYYSS